MIAGVPKETFPGERRVAVIPAELNKLGKLGIDVLVESGAGLPSGYADEAYREKGAQIAADRRELFSKADLILQVRCLGANTEAGRADLELIREGQTIVGSCDPLSEPEAARELAGTGANVMAMELIPRITRAQAMDILSSMATIAGYKAVLLAADRLPKMFPMLMTAAGTIKPAKVFIIGAGVAGLQAIATARRLGAIVHSYDVRPAVKEQVESLGAKFVEMELETGAAEDAGGYAKALGDDFYRKQRELMMDVVKESNIVITTAAIPGKKAPVLITTEMVEAMPAGAVIVDLAAERGGNCELTRAGEIVEHGGATILGPINLASSIPFDASQMYARNVSNLLANMVKDGEITWDMDDEITSGTLLARDGKVVHPMVLEALGEPTPTAEPVAKAEPGTTEPPKSSASGPEGSDR